ncbi:amino acid adenylation domain-containing protein [Endothiovibrio diazotrophicus]
MEGAPFSLSANQRALWWLHGYAPAGAAYHPAWAVRLHGGVEPAVVDRAVQALARRHPMTRLLIEVTPDGRPLQRAGAAARIPFTVTDAAAREYARLRDALRDANAAPFRLEREPPLRVHLFILGPAEAVLLVSMHHIATDGWSVGVLMEDLGVLLAHRGDAAAAGLETPVEGFAAFVAAEAAYLDGAAAAADLAFWRERLAGPLPTLALPFADRPRPRLRAFRGGSVMFTLPVSTTARLRAFAASALVTPFSVLMAAWLALLHRYGGQDELIVGTPTWGGRDAHSRGVVGYYANLLALRVRLDADITFSALIAAVKAEVNEALDHAAYPFATLVERLGLPRDPALTPLFQSTFAFHQTRPEDVNRTLFAVDGAARTEWGGFSATPLRVPEQGAGQFDLALDLTDLGESLAGELKYDRELFERATIGAMAESFACLLDGALAAPETPLGDLPLTAPETLDRHLLLANCPAPHLPDAPCLHQVFSARAAERPAAVALSGVGESLTYGELERRADGLANRLRGHGVGPGVRVGLCADRTPAQIVGLLAILKAGGAYVPLDPDYPAERLALIRDDARIALVVAPPEQAHHFPGATLISPDDAGEADGVPVDGGATPDDTAYVIYTSGSTGRPKGVPVSHRNVSRLFAATQEAFDFGPDDVWSLFHSLAFDFSVWEVWGALLHGGRLLLVDRWQARDPARLLELLENEGVTVLNQTPSAFHRLSAAVAAAGRRLTALRWVIFGGEALEARRLRPWVERHGIALVNMYGITETTVHVTLKRVTEVEIAAGGSNIGRPLADLELHLLDRRGRPVPLGMPGEIHVGGGGLAGGYLERPELTAAHFVPHPFRPGERLYRSGDLARRRPDGDLDYLGRCDAQLKVRGYRIEPGEIEAALHDAPGVAESAVAVVPMTDTETPGDEVLVAYLVPAAGGAPDLAALRGRLAGRLPPHMLPQHFVVLEALPRTPGGKLDRRALPAPRAAPDAAYAAPQGAAECAVAEAFAEALGVARVGRDDNYFALGGDSIRSIAVIAAARARGWALSLEALFRGQSVAAVAQAVIQTATPTTAERPAPAYRPFAALGEAERSRLPADAADAYPATSLQAGMIFHGMAGAAAGTYHDVFAFRLRGRLDAAALERAVEGLTAAHEVLRTRFDSATFRVPMQVVVARVESPLSVARDPWDGPLAELIAEQRERPFDPARAPLIRFHAVPGRDDDFRLVVAFHHAILDGWSLAALVTELLERYRSDVDGAAFDAPPPPRFADYVIGYELPARNDPAARDHWLKRIGDHLGTTLPRPLVPVAGGLRTLHRELDAGLVQRLTEQAERLGLPLRTLLLTTYLRVLGAMCGDRRPLIGVARHGRPEREGSECTLGLFLNTQPFILDLGAEPSWAAACRRCFDLEQADLPHRRYPLAEILRAGGRRQLFEALFNFVHFHVYDRVAALAGTELLEREAFEQTDLPLVLHAVQSGPALTLHLSHDPARLASAAADRLLAAMERALTALTDDPDAPHAAFGLMAEEELRAQPESWGGRVAAYPRQATIDRLFSEVATTRGRAEALCTPDGRSVDYAGLEARANRLAHLLQRRGVATGRCVAVLLPRGVEQVTACLAVLKAGAAYVPVEPDLPEARRSFILDDCDAAAVITDRHGAARLATARAVVVPEKVEDALAALPAEPPALPPRGAESPAYVIYTSGTTGQPKGVVCHHRGVVRLVRSGNLCQFSPEDRVVHAGAVIFDICMVEVWGALLNGAALVILPPGPPELATLAATLRATRASALMLATSVFHLVADECPEALAPLRRLLTGGEALSPAHAARALAHMAPDAALVNGYGPTENVTFTTLHRVTAADLAAGVMPIGRPIENSTVHLVDPFDQLLPPGIPGELLTGGDGVAIGYLGRPELTAERFAANPFPVPAGIDGGRLYRSGDIVVRGEGGLLHFLGRRDRQIKLRGFRIELGEIEQALRAAPGVRDAVVVVDEEAPAHRLVAYWVAGEGGDWPTVRDALAARLPDYMVPEVAVALESLPLSPVGKVDHHALPPPPAPGERPAARPATRQPGSESERIVHAVWSEVLGHDAFGIDDDFFALGGDSLHATQVASRLSRRLATEVRVTTVMLAPTVAGLAAEIDAATLALASPEALAALLADLDDGALLP